MKLTLSSSFRALLALVLAITSVACGGRIGPLVTDVHYGPNGELLVTRCMLHVTANGNVTTYEMKKCQRTSEPPPALAARSSEPAPAAPPTPAPPPVGASVTTVQ